MIRLTFSSIASCSAIIFRLSRTASLTSILKKITTFFTFTYFCIYTEQSPAAHLSTGRFLVLYFQAISKHRYHDPRWAEDSKLEHRGLESHRLLRRRKLLYLSQTIQTGCAKQQNQRDLVFSAPAFLLHLLPVFQSYLNKFETVQRYLKGLIF